MADITSHTVVGTSTNGLESIVYYNLKVPLDAAQKTFALPNKYPASLVSVAGKVESGQSLGFFVGSKELLTLDDYGVDYIADFYRPVGVVAGVPLAASQNFVVNVGGTPSGSINVVIAQKG